MPWYKVQYQNGSVDYRHTLSKSKLVFDCVRNGHWDASISEWKAQKLDYLLLKTFYEEIQSALHSGLQLNQAISHFAQSEDQAKIAPISSAILGQLHEGVPFNDALARLTQSTAAPYCQLLNSQGSREDCEKSLAMAIHQLDTLLEWSKRLLKTLIYPFSIIQLALIILIVNRALQPTEPTHTQLSLLYDLMLYFVCSGIQLVILHRLHQGHACHWLEKCSQTFRLTKLFSLLSTTRKTGITLQDALKIMPDYFDHQPIKQEIQRAYFTLRLGKNYAASFPKAWFPGGAAIALHSAEKDGDIERALILATKEHEKRWQKSISLLEKLIPAICLLIAGGAVAAALVTLYAPLLEIT